MTYIHKMTDVELLESYIKHSIKPNSDPAVIDLFKQEISMRKISAKNFTFVGEFLKQEGAVIRELQIKIPVKGGKINVHA